MENPFHLFADHSAVKSLYQKTGGKERCFEVIQNTSSFCNISAINPDLRHEIPANITSGIAPHFLNDSQQLF